MIDNQIETWWYAKILLALGYKRDLQETEVCFLCERSFTVKMTTKSWPLTIPNPSSDGTHWLAGRAAHAPNSCATIGNLVKDARAHAIARKMDAVVVARIFMSCPCRAEGSSRVAWLRPPSTAAALKYKQILHNSELQRAFMTVMTFCVKQICFVTDKL